MNKELKKFFFSIFVSLVLTIPFCGVYGINSLPNRAIDFASDAETSEVWSRSNITMPAVQNLTLIPSNFSSIEISSQINPTRSVIDIARGFEPMQRFNSTFNSTLVRKAYVGNCSLIRVDDELLLFLNASSGDQAAIAAYNLSFTNPVPISESDFISFALSTSDTYNSSEAYIGIALLLKDQQGNRHYVSIEVSNRNPDDSFGLSQWFLGWGFTKDYPKYPKYAMRYNNTSGPWFRQLPLSVPFAVLNLSLAWLDGLLIGGEIYSEPPFDIEKITEVNARFHYVLVHKQPFMINREIVNSTMMVFPFTNSLRFSGIPGERVNVIVEGSLKPSYDKEERQENETVNIHETFFNLSETVESEVLLRGTVNIAVLSKAVKKCTLTLNNNITIDLTDSLLGNNTIIHQFPTSAILLKVHLILYRFNAWFFSLYGFQPSTITKKGIVEEYFSPDKNEGTININSSETFPVNLAISSGNLMPSEITINGSKKTLESLLILNKQMYWIVPIVIPEENVSIYTVKYILSDEPSYQSLTTTPFSVYIDGYIFEIFTPFNVEGQEGTLIPLTIRFYTLRTYTLKIEYDPSMFEAERDEIMVYATRYHYEYFMLKPLRTGQTTINLRIIDPITMDTLFSSPFFVSIRSSFFTQVATYFLLGVAVFSLVYIFSKKSPLRWISRFRHYQFCARMFFVQQFAYQLWHSYYMLGTKHMLSNSQLTFREYSYHYVTR